MPAASTAAGPAAGRAADPPPARLEVRAWLAAGPCGAVRTDAPPCTASAAPAAHVAFEIRDAAASAPRARATSDPEGRFSLNLPPGRYVIDLAGSPLALRLEPIEVRLEPGATRALDLVIEALRP